MIVLIVSGVFVWGVIVGAVLMYLVGARYARDLHERIEHLEQPHAPQLSHVTLMEIVEAMEADDEFDEDAPPGVTH